MKPPEPTPFIIAIAEPVLADLEQRLDRTRPIDRIDGAGWDWGMETETLSRLLAHWRGFDWRKAEAALNALPHFKIEIDGVGLHYIHVRGQGARRLPIVLTNGWPSCFVELLPLLPLLTQEVDGLSFDVVIPSLPGYGFSDRPKAAGMNITRIAVLWAGLMTALGYERFLAHGSDMGAGVAERLRANHGDRIIGIHMVNLFSGYPAPAEPSAAEVRFLAEVPQWRMLEGAYAMLHATKPHSIAPGLNDSPAGLAAWVGEKLHTWTGPEPISLDAVCTILTIYWATETIASSQRLYREAFADVGAMSPPPRRGAPVAIAVFPHDILPAPRDWAERWLEVTQWTEMSAGGHFPALEVPDLLAADLRRFAVAL